MAYGMVSYILMISIFGIGIGRPDTEEEQAHSRDYTRIQDAA